MCCAQFTLAQAAPVSLGVPLACVNAALAALKARQARRARGHATDRGRARAQAVDDAEARATPSAATTTPATTRRRARHVTQAVAGLYLLVAHVRLHLQAAASASDGAALRDEFGTELAALMARVERAFARLDAARFRTAVAFARAVALLVTSMFPPDSS